MTKSTHCYACTHFVLDDPVRLSGHCKRTQYLRRAEEVCAYWEEKTKRTCSTCQHWACMNHKDLIGACTIWHESGKTWPKSNECCPHHEEIKHKGGEADADKR